MGGLGGTRGESAHESGAARLQSRQKQKGASHDLLAPKLFERHFLKQMVDEEGVGVGGGGTGAGASRQPQMGEGQEGGLRAANEA